MTQDNQENLQEDTQESVQEEVVQEVSFDQLIKKQKVFVDRKPVKREIVWEQQDEDGKTEKIKFNVFVRRQNFATFSNYLSNPNDQKNNSRLIAESLAKDEKGEKNLLTLQQVESLHPMLAILFLNAINEVNTKKN